MIDCKEFGFKDPDKEERSRGADPITLTNYPFSAKKFRLVYQSFNQSLEDIYYWLLASMREDFGFHEVTKVTDVFSASEQSAFWGQAQQRLSIQQGQVSNYMATIGKLTKELFQIVRELRILDERIDLYTESNKLLDKEKPIDRRKSLAAETVLKGYWVDLKDGGVKSPGSVYGLASSLGYTVLPDIFFGAPALKKDEIDDYVNGLKFNKKVKSVLMRKLQAYTTWKEHTFKELTNRHRFTLKFLRQHYNSIQMYIDWLKPYLHNVKRLSQNMNRTMSEDLIGAFEGSMTEVEIICKRKVNKYYAAIVMTILFRTQAHMDFHKEGYQQRGPVHVGRSEITLRGYVWTQEDFDNFVKMKQAETLDMLGDIDVSLKESIDALGDDLRRYLKEDEGEKFPEDIRAEEEKKKKEAEARKKAIKGAAEPFTAVFSGFRDIFRTFIPSREGPKKKDVAREKWEMGKAYGPADKVLEIALWNTYKNFKTAHKMVKW